MSDGGEGMGFGARSVIVLPLALIGMLVFVYIDGKVRPNSYFIWLTYAGLLWIGLWWMWHPRLSTNPFRYLLNVGGLLGMAIAGSAPLYAFLYLLLRL